MGGFDLLKALNLALICLYLMVEEEELYQGVGLQSQETDPRMAPSNFTYSGDDLQGFRYIDC